MHASSEPFKPFIDRWRASPFFGALNEESLATFVAQIKQINLRKLEVDDLIEVNRQQIRIINRIELERLAT